MVLLKRYNRCVGGQPIWIKVKNDPAHGITYCYIYVQHFGLPDTTFISQH